MFRRIRLGWILQVWLSLLLGACTLVTAPGPSPLTQAALTVGAAFTQVALEGQGTRTPPAASPSEELTSAAPAGTATQAILPSPLPASPAPICYQLRFEADVTLPDDTPVQPGVTLVKTWRVRNTGSCPWTAETRVAFVSGNRMAGSLSQPIGQAVAVGSEAEISVTLTAPSQPGTYLGYWMLVSPEGNRFGYGPAADQAFWVEIVVLGTPAPTATATQTQTATPGLTVTVTPSSTPTPQPTTTATLPSSATPTPAPSATQVGTSTSVPTPSATPTA